MEDVPIRKLQPGRLMSSNDPRLVWVDMGSPPAQHSSPRERYTGWARGVNSVGVIGLIAPALQCSLVAGAYPVSMEANHMVGVVPQLLGAPKC